MRKPWKLLSVLLGLLLTLVGVAACAEPEGDSRPYYLVEVEGGTGGGYYYGDTNCTVVADVPAGKQFMMWTADGNGVSANATYTFTVTKNIKLTAVLADDVEDVHLYTLNVQCGTGSGVFVAGSEREIAVSERYSGLTFKGWMEVTEDEEGNEVRTLLSTENPYRITLTKDVTVAAEFEGFGAYPTPDNTEGQYFRIAANGAYEFDREGAKEDSVFDDSTVEYLVYAMYESPDDNARPVATFKIVHEESGSFHAYLSDMAGAVRQTLKGSLGDLYHDEEGGKAQIRSILGVKAGMTYYFDVQIFGTKGVSAVSAKGPGYTF